MFYIICMSQKAFSSILILAMIVIGIATIANSVNITLAQFNSTIPFSPSTGQSPSNLSPPSTPPPSDTNQPIKANPSHTGNSTTTIVNSSTIGPPSRPIVVGPSNFTASPISSENQANLNASSTSPSNNGSSIGPPR
jgi:hypothetical protein